MSDAKCLMFCLSLAAGEFLAARHANCAEAWPLVVAVAVFVALFGHGLAWRMWPYVFVALLGLALYLGASVEGERRYRTQPWMRGVRCGGRGASAQHPLAAAVRRDLSRRLGLGVRQDSCAAALTRAILLGERERMPYALKRVFVESGTIHLFAISGLHVMAVARVLLYLMALALLPRRWSGVAALPFLWGYVAVIGCPPSAVRAALMASVSFLAPLGWRRPNSVRAWAIAFFLVHVVDPLKLSDVGSLLSFVVMLAILLAVRFGEGVFSPWRQLLWVSFATWAVGVPIAAYVFGRVTPGGLMANLPLLPVTGGTVMAGAIGLVVSLVSPALAAYFNNLSALGVRLMVVVADMVARMPGATLNVSRWGEWRCAAWYLAVSLCFVFVWYRRRRRALV